MAKLFRINGTEETVQPENGVSFTCDELQSFVGNYFELVPLKNNKMMVCNEDGKLLNLSVNVKATSLAWQNGFTSQDFLVGDVLYCEENEVE